MNLVHVAQVGGAGAAGAVTRYALNRFVLRQRESDQPFPTGTLLINISGSLILGLLTGFVIYHAAPATLTRVAGSGFCGGYTTFSAASFETVQLHRDGGRGLARMYLMLTVAGTLLAGGVGLALASL